MALIGSFSLIISTMSNAFSTDPIVCPWLSLFFPAFYHPEIYEYLIRTDGTISIIVMYSPHKSALLLAELVKTVQYYSLLVSRSQQQHAKMPLTHLDKGHLMER